MSQQPPWGPQGPGNPGQYPPPNQPPPGQPPYSGQPWQPGWGPQPLPPRKNWFLRHKVLTAVLGVIALFVIIGIAAGVSGGGSSQSSATSAPSPTAAISAMSAAPQAPSPSKTTAAPSAHTVAKFSGSGQENTPRFTVTDTWKLDYSFSCADFGSRGNFQVYEDGGDDFNLSVNDLATSKTSSTWAYNDGGTHYLQINSECSWNVKVVDEP